MNNVEVVHSINETLIELGEAGSWQPFVSCPLPQSILFLSPPVISMHHLSMRWSISILLLAPRHYIFNFSASLLNPTTNWFSTDRINQHLHLSPYLFMYMYMYMYMYINLCLYICTLISKYLSPSLSLSLSLYLSLTFFLCLFLYFTNSCFLRFFLKLHRSETILWRNFVNHISAVIGISCATRYTLCRDNAGSYRCSAPCVL